MDFDLMPPPGSSKKAGTSMDVDQTIDPNEPTYCICHQVSFEDNMRVNIFWNLFA
jgi:inhibitor of growth protein 4